MIKYRVTDVAKDLQISNKAVIEAIEKYCGETKKAMTALNEHELDIVLETFTQGKSVKSLDAFFADNGQNEEQPDAPAAEAAPAPAKPAAPAAESRKKADEKAAPAKNNRAGQDRRQNGDRSRAPRGKEEPRAARPARPAQPAANKQPAAQVVQEENNRPATRLVDTRSSQVDVERYNEKYDRLASEKIRTDNTVQKQKLNQRSQRRGKPRNSRKETEAERLRRIAMERKAKPLTITVPDEIVVSELASRLKATVGEVIKKLMLMGVMAADQRRDRF